MLYRLFTITSTRMITLMPVQILKFNLDWRLDQLWIEILNKQSPFIKLQDYRYMQQ